MLEGTLEVAAMLSENATELQWHEGRLRNCTTKNFHTELHNYRRTVDCHIRNVRRHLGFSDSIRIRVSLRPLHLPSIYETTIFGYKYSELMFKRL